MDIDTLVIVEELEGRPCLFVNPVREDGEIHIESEIEGVAWLELGEFRACLEKGRPIRLRASLGRHSLRIRPPQGDAIPLALHVDPNGDERAEFRLFEDADGPAVKLCAKLPPKGASEGFRVGFQTTPQKLASCLEVRKAGRAGRTIDLPERQPFQWIDVEREDFPLRVRFDDPGKQNGGTVQVDIIVE